MSIRLMSAVWSLDLPDSEKIVLLALADCADDNGACWPSIATLSRKVSKTDRTVQAAIKGLCEKGHILRVEVRGKGCSYTVTPRSDFTPETISPPKRTTLTPEAVSDKPSRTINTKKAKASLGGARRERLLSHALPVNFEPILTVDAEATIADWPPGMFEREMAQWRDYHSAKGSLAKDWQASLRTWLRNAERYRTERNGRLPHRTDSMGGSGTDTSGASIFADLERRREARGH